MSDESNQDGATKPRGWTTASLESLAALRPHAITDGPFGSNLKSAHYTDAGPRVVRLQNIGDGVFHDEQAHISEQHFSTLSKHAVSRGNIVMAILGEVLPRACLVPDWLGPAIVKADCVKIAIDERAADPRFVRDALNSLEVRRSTSRLIKGIGRPRLNLRQARAIEIPVPPRPEQARIADRIDELFTDLAAGVAALERVQKKLKRYRSAVLHAAVTGRLTEAWRKELGPPAEPGQQLLERLLVERRRQWEERTLADYEAKGKQPPKNWQQRYKEPVEPKTDDLPELPEGWCWASVDHMSWDCSYGTSVRCDYNAEGVSVLRIPNIAKGDLDLSDLKNATASLELEERDLLLPGDLLVCRTNGSIRLIGKSALVRNELDSKCYFASYLIRFRISDPSVAEVIHCVCESPLGRKYIEANCASSAGQHNISMTVLQQLPVPLPPAGEQPEIASSLAEKLSQIEAMEIEVERGLSRATRLRQAVLKSAFAGELVAQDPDDEPASVLLERIRTEREAIAAESNGRPNRSPRKRVTTKKSAETTKKTTTKKRARKS